MSNAKINLLALAIDPHNYGAQCQRATTSGSGSHDLNIKRRRNERVQHSNWIRVPLILSWEPDRKDANHSRIH
jgi:hypothetical protein